LITPEINLKEIMGQRQLILTWILSSSIRETTEVQMMLTIS
jgi:hypothetical protein